MGTLKNGYSQRELQILQLYAQGLTTRQVAKVLSLSHHTVESHKQNMITRLDAKNVVHLIVKAMREGVI